MDNDRRPPQAAEVLRTGGISVGVHDGRIGIDLKADGAVRLARALQHAQSRVHPDEAVSLLLGDLIRPGRLARQRARQGNP